MVVVRKRTVGLRAKAPLYVLLAAVVVLSGTFGFAAAREGMANKSTQESAAVSDSPVQETLGSSVQETSASPVQEASAGSYELHQEEAAEETSLVAVSNSDAGNTAEDATTAPDATSEDPSVQTSDGQDGIAEGETEDQAEEVEEEAASAADASLAWRDSDFAVSPERVDWNYNSNGRKVVYLTIDDGPSEITPQVLDVLDRYNCKATFFVVGHDPDSYHFIKDAYDRGHTIGLHTYSHDYAEVYSSVDAYFADLDRIGQVVKDQIGYVPCFIRFPGGSSNMISAEYTTGIMSALAPAVQDQGYQYYDWTGSVGDGSEHTAEEILGYAKETPLEENIVLLCHDSETKQTTLDALPQIIEYFQGEGYSFEAIDRNTWVCQHGVQN